MFGRFGWMEILVIVVLVVILFSHNKIPGMMKNLADGINIFKKELKNTPSSESKTIAPAKVSEKPAPKKATAAKPATVARKTAAKKSPVKKSTDKKAKK